MVKPLVYIAGPLTKGEQTINIHNAILVGEWVFNHNGMPLIPHLNQLWDYLYPKSWETWMEICLSILGRADFMVWLPGESEGTKMEINYCMRNNIPYFSYNTIKDFNNFDFGGCYEKRKMNNVEKHVDVCPICKKDYQYNEYKDCWYCCCDEDSFYRECGP